VGALIGTSPQPLYLADTSALVRLRLRPVAEFLEPLIEQGLIAHCGPVDTEMLRTARNAKEIDDMRHWLAVALPLVPVTQSHFDRAMEVIQLLAAANLHRAAKTPDLVIAAIGEASGLTVVHYDADFDLIASVTGQETRWVAPRGSLEVP
jgi:predicted nucleic acid-binding protein